jgi:hypothetical protein
MASDTGRCIRLTRRSRGDLRGWPANACIQRLGADPDDGSADPNRLRREVHLKLLGVDVVAAHCDCDAQLACKCLTHETPSQHAALTIARSPGPFRLSNSRSVQASNYQTDSTSVLRR